MGAISEPCRREEHVLENVLVRMPIVLGVRLVIEGDVVRCMVRPLGAVDPNSSPVEGHRRRSPKLRRQRERPVTVPAKNGGTRSIIGMGLRTRGGCCSHPPEVISRSPFAPGPRRGIVYQRAYVVQRDLDFLHHGASGRRWIGVAGRGWETVQRCRLVCRGWRENAPGAGRPKKRKLRRVPASPLTAPDTIRPRQGEPRLPWAVAGVGGPAPFLSSPASPPPTIFPG